MIKSYTQLIFFIICAMFVVIIPYIANAQITINNPLQYDKIEDIIPAITDLLANIAIPIAGIMILVSGIQYLVSAGNEEKARKAKNTMLYTVIGFAIILGIKFIVGFITEILGKL